MRKTGRDAVGSSILYPLFGFRMERRNAACVAEDRLAGEEDGTIVDCVGVASVQTVPEASSTYLTQMPRDLENLRAPAMPAMKRCFR
jgi:hypothetical protein